MSSILLIFGAPFSIDMGQGLLQCISEIYEQIHIEKSTELGVLVNGRE